MKRINRFAVPTARVLLGGMFVFASVNYFFHLTPMAPPPGAAGEFMGGLVASGYFFTFLKVTELTVGILLLSGRFVPLALTVLAPIMLNIFAFHLFLAPKGLGIAVALGLLQVYLAWSYRDAFTAVLRMNAHPRPLRTENRESSSENRAASAAS